MSWGTLSRTGVLWMAFLAVAVGGSAVLRPGLTFAVLGAASGAVVVEWRRRQRAPSSPSPLKSAGGTLSRARAATALVPILVLAPQVWRVRSTASILSQPWDVAALVRTALFLGALTLGAAVLYRTSAGMRDVDPLPRWAAILFLVYAIWSLLGMLEAVVPLLVLYRGFELLVVALASIAVLLHGESDDEGFGSPTRALTAAYVALIAVAVAGLFIHPELAWRPVQNSELHHLYGVFPVQNPNTLGMYGVILMAMGLGGERRDGLGGGTLVARGSLVGLGVVILLLTQYRTGFMAGSIVLIAWAVLGRRHLVAVLAATVVTLALVVGGWSSLESYITQGQHISTVQSLHGRTLWWDAAINATSRSPVVGLGLSSGSRAEVLSQVVDRPLTGTLHNTWVEAYTGTGVIGVALLGGSMILTLLAGLRRSLRTGVASAGLLIPLALLVRSVTGETIEVATPLVVSYIVAIWVVGSRTSGGQRRADN